MKITRKQLRQLIKENLLVESRRLKHQFREKIIDRYPDIKDAFYVHWIKSDVNQWDRLRYKLEMILGGTNREFSSNLVDPSGQTVNPHFGDWGSIGIVFKGIPTYGSHWDAMASVTQTNSGKRLYPTVVRTDQPEFPDDEPLEDFEEIYIDSDDSNEDYNVSTSLERLSPDIISMDLSVEKPFLTHHEGFPYSGSEFFIVPKKVMGVVYIQEKDSFFDKTKNNFLLSSQNFPQITHVEGIENIGKFYRTLYNNNI